MNYIKRVVVDEASEVFWDAFAVALECDDLECLKSAAETLRLASPAAAEAIADVIEAGEGPGKPVPIIKWLVAALRGPLATRLH
jgi:HEAT repeat protein